MKKKKKKKFRAKKNTGRKEHFPKDFMILNGYLSAQDVWSGAKN